MFACPAVAGIGLIIWILCSLCSNDDHDVPPDWSDYSEGS